MKPSSDGDGDTATVGAARLCLGVMSVCVDVCMSVSSQGE